MSATCICDVTIDGEGSNRTRIYTVSMVIRQDIPEWLPLDGLRVRIQYLKMKKLCNGCYNHHLRKDCNNPKISWTDYVNKFSNEYAEIQYKKWIEQIGKTKLKCPSEKDLNLPTSRTEWDEMNQMMNQCGIDEPTMETNHDEIKELKVRESPCGVQQAERQIQSIEKAQSKCL